MHSRDNTKRENSAISVTRGFPNRVTGRGAVTASRKKSRGGEGDLVRDIVANDGYSLQRYFTPLSRGPDQTNSVSLSGINESQ